MNEENNKINTTLKSLIGLWVGDCIGNIGQLYFAHDILKALDEGIVKLGIDNINPMGKGFQYSDDTEEAIVLVNHLIKNKEIKQDELAMEWATRYMKRDPDGEIFGYGLMTRKVLRDIYEGKPWREANLTFRKSEGPSNVDNILGDIASGKSIKDAFKNNRSLLIPQTKSEMVGSCGNGSVMRIPPLGAYFNDKPIEYIIEQAKLSAEPTHSHPEGIAGAIAIALLSKLICSFRSDNLKYNMMSDMIYDNILMYIPESQVKDGIKKAKMTYRNIPLMKAVEILGNGTHVTCQDTVPLCVYLTINALTTYSVDKMYEEVLIDTCKCFGDVDTNCAIVGGMIGIISSPPEKWIRYCMPMEGLLNDPLPETSLRKRPKNFGINKDAIKEAMKNTVGNLDHNYVINEQYDYVSKNYLGMEILDGKLYCNGDMEKKQYNEPTK